MKKIFLLIIIIIKCTYTDALLAAVPVLPSQIAVALTPQNLGFEYHMNSDDDHLKVENQIPLLAINIIEQLPRYDVYGLLSPLLRLDKKHLKKLTHRSGIKQAEGCFTIGDLTLISGKEYLQQNKGDLLLEKGEWDKTTKEFRLSYRLPGNDQIGKTVTLKLSNILVKNPGTPLAQFLSSVVEYPEGVSFAQPAPAVPPVIVVEESYPSFFW